MEVLACYNPLKQIRFEALYKASNGSVFVEHEHKWNITVVPEYMDLTTGIWNVTLDSYIYKLKVPNKIDTVFDISTNLCTSYQTEAKTNLNRSVFTRLGCIHAVSPLNLANFGPFEKKWFLVEPKERQFQLFINQNKMSVSNTPKLEVEFEISFLFQRIK